MSYHAFNRYNNAAVNLITAFLLGEGEISKDQDHYILTSELNESAVNYLKSLLKDEVSESDFFISEWITGDYASLVFTEKIMNSFYTSWYQEGQKLFHPEQFNGHFSLETFIIFINIYGHRDSQGVTMKSSIHPAYKKALALYIKNHLNIDLVPYNQNRVFKSFDMPDLLSNIHHAASVRHMAHFFQMINNRDIKDARKERGKETQNEMFY